MSQPQPSTPHAMHNGAQLQLPSNPMTGRRQQTTADFRPPQLRHLHSLAAPTRLRRNGTNRTNLTSHTGRTVGLTNTSDRAEKKQEQTVDIENDYFALNPWYNQQKDKPVFGLGAPIPRTVRRGMWWGRRDLRNSPQKVGETHDEGGMDRQDGVDFDKDLDLANDSEETLVPPEHDRHTQIRQPSDYFQSSPHTNHECSTRQPTEGIERSLHRHDHKQEPQERAPVNEHGLAYTNDHDAPARHQFGLADARKRKDEIQQWAQQAQQDYYTQYRNPVARLRAQYPQALAEFLATFVYLFLGICVNLSVATSKSTTGSFETQAWGWGFAVMIEIYLGSGVSGAHLSPTISLSLMFYRGFPWRMAFVYICVQMLAGLSDPELTIEITGGAMFPKGPSFSTAGGLFNDFVYMAIYVCMAFALGDDQNSTPGQGMTALIFGLTGFVTMIALGYNTGLSISPARDLGPRLLGLWAGYDEAFKGGYWWYGLRGASISGAFFGRLMYDLFIFVGGESPVNYRWSEAGDIKWKGKEAKRQAKDKIQRIA
ncbi:aquaporin-like protein [Setomelanomma holmii]|uniref:Aquaporin-like protein n=1 Tax=Setomelanomma holmii TaxID=210430 RepID=A0A9P4H7A6_9PLEO|nr:aquaporin-like protein [Setomelanomma holmii]